MPLSLPALTTLLALMWYFVTIFQVGRMRTRYKVNAPATTGDPAFERAYRVQMNELENLVLFLPAMWIYAWFGNPRYAALACCVYILGRILYAVGYWMAASKRGWGYMVAMFATSITWVAALVAVLKWVDFA